MVITEDFMKDLYDIYPQSVFIVGGLISALENAFLFLQFMDS